MAILRRAGDKWEEPEYHTLTQRHKGLVTKTYETQRIANVVSELQRLQVFNLTALAALEDYAYGVGKSGKTNCMFQLGELGGTVRYLLYQHEIPFIPCPISVNKQFATGNGAAQKEEVADAMAALWHLPKFTRKQYDSSDALSLASVAAFRFYNGLPGLNTYRYQARIVEPLEIVHEGKNRNG